MQALIAQASLGKHGPEMGFVFTPPLSGSADVRAAVGSVADVPGAVINTSIRAKSK